jgi:hypothetical protein
VADGTGAGAGGTVVSLEIVVRCDDCYVAGDSGSWKTVKGHTLRARLKRVGWFYDGRIDLCSDCLAQRKFDGMLRRGPRL